MDAYTVLGVQRNASLADTDLLRWRHMLNESIDMGLSLRQFEGVAESIMAEIEQITGERGRIVTKRPGGVMPIYMICLMAGEQCIAQLSSDQLCEML